MNGCGRRQLPLESLRRLTRHWFSYACLVRYVDWRHAGALSTTILPGIKPQSVLGWLGTFLYLPDVPYIVISVLLLFSGPGWLSLDRLLMALGRPMNDRMPVGLRIFPDRGMASIGGH